jgi:tyrosyl-tRNA synthetase
MGSNQDVDKVLERGVSEILPSKDALRQLITKKKITLYQGFDPTSPHLHIGNLVGARKLAQFQKLGHKVIFLIGDFTGLIGDPTDKQAARKRLTKKEVEENSRGYQEQLKNVLDFEGGNAVEIKYNSEWLSDLKMKDIIELSSNFTVQQLIERDMFRKRLEKNRPIYLHEFLYPLMQGYDSSAMGVDLEIGGNDQLFNMLAGRVLVKSLNDKEKFVLTMKLLVGSDNQKMGKSEGNTVNLSDEPENLYGKIMALPDDIIKPGIELLTDLPMDAADGEPMDAKKKLALDVVSQIHGEDSAKIAEEYFEKTIREGGLPEKPEEISLGKGSASLSDVIEQLGFAESKSQAKRLISQGAVEIDGKKVCQAYFLMNFSKKQQKLFKIIIVIAGLALLATTFLPLFYAFY